MKNSLLLATLFLCILTYAQDLPAYQIFTKTGKKTSYKKLKKASLAKSYVFFGEHHDNPIIHWLQLELLNELYNKHGKNLICGSEMYEQDNQKQLDKYLTGSFDSKQFNDSCRLWPNQATDYQPMLDFCKEKQLPWIATNIPRKYASQVYKKGVKSLEDLSEQEKKWLCPLPFPLDTSLSQYAALLNSEMHMGNNFVYAQAIKDATMAYFIYKSLKPNSVFYHLNGAYHSDYSQGILWYLNYYAKADYAEMLSISTVTQENISKLDNEHIGKADFIICVPERMTRTH